MAAQTLIFRDMKEAELRQWVEANPGRVNDMDVDGRTPLSVALRMKSLPLTVWLLDEKGANMNNTTWSGSLPLHEALSLDILNALLNRGADPTFRDHDGRTVLIHHSHYGKVANVARLLQDPRVQATINEDDHMRNTALHFACDSEDETAAISIVNLLLQAGADPALPNRKGQTPLAWHRFCRPTHHTAIALLEQYPDAQKDAEKASLFVKARRLAAVSRNAAAPSYLQGRMARGQPLPGVVLTLVAGGQSEDEDEEEVESRKLRTMAAFLLGMEGGPENTGMPRDVFRVVLDLLMPSWDPLRRNNAGTRPPLQPA